MSFAKAIPPLLNFLVIILILVRTAGTELFSPIDINLSLAALLISVIVEIMLIRKR